LVTLSSENVMKLTMEHKCGGPFCLMGLR